MCTKKVIEKKNERERNGEIVLFERRRIKVKRRRKGRKRDIEKEGRKGTSSQQYT